MIVVSPSTPQCGEQSQPSGRSMATTEQAQGVQPEIGLRTCIPEPKGYSIPTSTKQIHTDSSLGPGFCRVSYFFSSAPCRSQDEPTDTDADLRAPVEGGSLRGTIMCIGNTTPIPRSLFEPSQVSPRPLCLCAFWQVTDGFLIIGFTTFYTFKFSVCGWVPCLNVFLCTVCVSGTYGGHKRTLRPLELELQLLAVIEVLGIESLDSGRAASSQMPNHLSSPSMTSSECRPLKDRMSCLSPRLRAMLEQSSCSVNVC